MKTLALLFLSCMTLASAVANAQGCHPPGSFYRTSMIRGSLVMQPGAGADCDLVATLGGDNSVAAGAFAWYRLNPPVTSSWRIAFRLDLSEVSLPHPFDSFDVLAATARAPYPSVSGNVLPVGMAVLGDYGFGGGKPFTPTFVFACTSGLSDMCVANSPDALADGDLVRIEVVFGPGAAGTARWWINGDFGDPPAGEVDNLDNAAWGGVSSVALGAFMPQGTVRSSGVRVRISDIESSDDALFFASFDG